MIGEGEIPEHSEVTYLLEAPAQVENAEEEKKDAEEKPKGSDEISVVFCIDISGSMHGQRLNAARQAITSQINSMNEKNGKRKLGIVAFDNTVEVIGDGVEKVHVIADMADLTNFEALQRIGEGLGDTHMKNPVSQTKDSLLEKAQNLQTRGTTALGPAVLTSLAMASKGCPGSQVIVLTDGMANVGLGSFNQGQSANEFYSRVGQLAEEKGVMINLVTFAGTEANIMGLATMVEQSGGQVE